MTKILILALILLITLLSLQILFGSYPQRSEPLPDFLTELSPTPTPLPLPPLDINSVFSSNHSWTKNLDPAKTVTLIATGDIIPVRITNITATQKNDFTWAFKNIAPVLSAADITFINLETPLIQNCPLSGEGFKFCGDYRHIEGIKLIGTDVANLANNHTTNYGLEALRSTDNLLNISGIQSTGFTGPAFEYVKDINFAFLGYNALGNIAGISNAEDEKVCQEIKTVRSQAGVVVVQFHWGAEYRAQPDESQKHFGRLAIDCGADLVIGNHPHWIQPVEFYNNKLITYAHGNTVFDQEWSQKTKEGVIGRYTFFEGKLVDVEYLPILIKDFGQPTFLEGEPKQKILNEMKIQTEILQNPRE